MPKLISENVEECYEKIRKFLRVSQLTVDALFLILINQCYRQKLIIIVQMFVFLSYNWIGVERKSKYLFDISYECIES